MAARSRGKVLWCLTRADLFAPAFAQAGLVPDRVIYVEVGDDKTVLACMEEGLREDASSGIRYKAGDRIRHRVFGEGTVEEVQEAEQAYTIHFDGMMTARKIAFRVKMEKIR